MPTKELRAVLEARWKACELAGWMGVAVKHSPDDEHLFDLHVRAKMLADEIGARVEKEQEATP